MNCLLEQPFDESIDLALGIDGLRYLGFLTEEFPIELGADVEPYHRPRLLDVWSEGSKPLERYPIPIL